MPLAVHGHDGHIGTRALVAHQPADAAGFLAEDGRKDQSIRIVPEADDLFVGDVLELLRGAEHDLMLRNASRCFSAPAAISAEERSETMPTMVAALSAGAASNNNAIPDQNRII